MIKLNILSRIYTFNEESPYFSYLIKPIKKAYNDPDEEFPLSWNTTMDCGGTLIISSDYSYNNKFWIAGLLCSVAEQIEDEMNITKEELNIYKSLIKNHSIVISNFQNIEDVENQVSVVLNTEKEYENKISTLNKLYAEWGCDRYGLSNRDPKYPNFIIPPGLFDQIYECMRYGFMNNEKLEVIVDNWDEILKEEK